MSLLLFHHFSPVKSRVYLEAILFDDSALLDHSLRTTTVIFPIISRLDALFLITPVTIASVLLLRQTQVKLLNRYLCVCLHS